jgi:hypothetical protein
MLTTSEKTDIPLFNLFATGRSGFKWSFLKLTELWMAGLRFTGLRLTWLQLYCELSIWFGSVGLYEFSVRNVVLFLTVLSPDLLQARIESGKIRVRSIDIQGSQNSSIFIKKKKKKKKTKKQI